MKGAMGSLCEYIYLKSYCSAQYMKATNLFIGGGGGGGGGLLLHFWL